jgi:hypothetical protein
LCENDARISTYAFIHEEKYQSSLSTYAFIQNFICDLQSVEEVEKKQPDRPRPPSTACTRWRAPPDGVIKINVDTAVSNNLNKGAVAAVARNNNGTYMGASAVIFQGRSDPETLEALAYWEALSLGADIWGFESSSGK